MDTVTSFSEVQAWAYAVDRKLGRQQTRDFLEKHTGCRYLRDIDPVAYDKLIVVCQAELGTVERPPDSDFGIQRR